MIWLEYASYSRYVCTGHNMVREIQATIPSTREKPTKGPTWKGVVVAFIGVAFCCFPAVVIGNHMFGNSVDGNILIALEKPAWLFAAANMFVRIHVVGEATRSLSFQCIQFTDSFL